MTDDGVGYGPSGARYTPSLQYCFDHDDCWDVNSIYRYWSPITSDHFYTQYEQELGVGEVGDQFAGTFTYEGVAFYLFTEQPPNTVPVYRYWSESAQDHFYTTNNQEIGTTTPGQTGNHGYTFEGVIGHAFVDQFESDVAVYRYWKASVGDHFYTTDASEVGVTISGQVGNYDYKSEGIAFYALNPDYLDDGSEGYTGYEEEEDLRPLGPTGYEDIEEEEDLFVEEDHSIEEDLFIEEEEDLDVSDEDVVHPEPTVDISPEQQEEYQQEADSTSTMAGFYQKVLAHTELGEMSDHERSVEFDVEYPHAFDKTPICSVTLGGFLVLPGAKVGVFVEFVSTTKSSFRYRISVPPGAAVQVVKINYLATERSTMSFGSVELGGADAGELNSQQGSERSVTKDVSLPIQLNNPRAFAGISGFYCSGNTDSLTIGATLDHANTDGASVRFSAGDDTKVFKMAAIVVAFEETGL
mmetsp:Transcript_20152/g.17297  ORF Transcript_20152/g.17297 Transcript_20152/m.17297 type:complete len:468 (+) Transcript_20152:271-1674(+)